MAIVEALGADAGACWRKVPSQAALSPVTGSAPSRSQHRGHAAELIAVGLDHEGAVGRRERQPEPRAAWASWMTSWAVPTHIGTLPRASR